MTQVFYLDLKQIPDEQSAKMAAQVLVQTLVVNDVFKKQVGKDFFNKCLRNFEDDRASPQLKFNTLSIFRHIDLGNRDSLKVFSILAGHPVFAYFVQQAKNVDPRKSVSEKGKSFFPKNKELGNKFIRLILESIKFWSERFPTTAKKQPTKYQKTYLKLVDEKVTFPDTYIFYSMGQPGEEKQQKVTPGGVDPNKYARQNEKQMAKIQAKNTPKIQVNNGQQEKIPKTSIMLLFNKIQSYIGFLEDAQSIDELYKQVNKNHQMFQKEQKRLSTSNVLSIEDDKIVNLYLKINEFFLDEFEIYQEWISQKDSLKMYIDTLLIKYDNTFSEQLGEGVKTEEKPPLKKQVSTISNGNKSTTKDKNEPSKDKEKFTSQNGNTSTISNKQNSKEDKKKYESTNSERQKERPSNKRRQEDDDEQQTRSKLKEKKSNVDSEQIKDRALRGFFESHLERPANKSLSGFKAIKQSLQKQKKQLKANPGRGKSPISSTSKSKFNASTVSKIQPNSIFAKPPNPNIRSKKYEGTFVLSNPQLEGILHDVEREQGIKRFKTSNLKNRALLFESEHIQVGYKSQAVYQKTEGLNDHTQMIQLQLYIGNKTKDDIRNFSVQFHGDQKSLVYSNPQKAPETIYAGDQCIFTAIIIPCAQSYTMTMMHVAYTFNSYQIHTNCLLPSTILKFANYGKADVRDMNDYERTQSIKCFQTEKFQLSHYFPPRKIAHYIEELVQITSYSEFVENESQKDFVLGVFVTVKNKHKGLLKINVRPDLSVVLQLMSDNQSQDAYNDFKLYLQTLWMVLKQHK